MKQCVYNRFQGGEEMDLGERIKDRRLKLELTLEDVGNAVGVSKSTVMKWETGYIENMKRDKIVALSKALKVSPLWVMGIEEVTEYKNSVLIPVYGSIPAGVPLEAIEDIQGEVDIPVDWTRGGREYIALKVVGDSMYPKYLNGDTVIILLQSDCENGQDCACYVNGYEATLKTIKKGVGKIELIPINQNYPPQTYKHPGEVSILGVVKELRRKP